MNKQLVDNNTYNLITALASNLEAHEAYMKYAKDGNSQLWEQLSKNTEQAVQLLQQALMSQGMNAQSGMGNQASMNQQPFATQGGNRS